MIIPADNFLNIQKLLIHIIRNLTNKVTVIILNFVLSRWFHQLICITIHIRVSLLLKHSKSNNEVSVK